MIGEFNRANPYIVQINETTEPLRLKGIRNMAKFMRSSIAGLLITIILSFFDISWKSRIIMIVFLVFCIVMGYLNMYKVLKISPLPRIIRILYGTQYEKIYVNNEELLKLIQQMSAYSSSLDTALYCNKHMFIILGVIDIITVALDYITKYLF